MNKKLEKKQLNSRSNSTNGLNPTIQENATESNAIQIPKISLPKGGGAIKGIDEKFTVNPATGTANQSIPIFTSPGRSDFGPKLSLNYNSGSGNGPFGLGWSLDLPEIARKTDKGIPQYRDAEESDIFILSGAEDLVPFLKKNGTNWDRVEIPDRVENGVTYIVTRYRPRIEGLFARIEQWKRNDNGNIHWRSISKDNVTSIYGKNQERIDQSGSKYRPNSIIVDPNNEKHIFKWLIEESYDDKGNVIFYEYKQENEERLDPQNLYLKNRLGNNFANQYIKRIKYCNQNPNERTGWLMEVVFDYGDHDIFGGNPEKEGTWKIRKDPFSNYRAGFEIRTQRLCERILMFNHFDELGNNHLVKSTDLTYEPGEAFTYLIAATQTGYKKENGTYQAKSLPPIVFSYTKPDIKNKIKFVKPENLENLPIGADGQEYQFVDIHGEGISGILSDQNGAWYYKSNLGNGDFGAQTVIAEKPSLAQLQSGQGQIMDLAGDGTKDVAFYDSPVPGFYEHKEDEGWKEFRNFKSLPNVNWKDPNLRFVDLNGDGHADILVTEDEVFTWYSSEAEDGFDPSSYVRKTLDEENGPTLVLADGTQSIFLSDMSGDGLTDLVRIRNGEICYWPNLGYGRFGRKISMDNAPLFDLPDQFSHARLRLADIDGTGTTDIFYLSNQGVKFWFNQAGNSWSTEKIFTNFPPINNVISVDVFDLLGTGTACLVWSSPLPGDAGTQMRYVDFMDSKKPHLLETIDNNMGKVTMLKYVSSIKFYLEDKSKGKKWVTKLPFPVHVLERVEVFDAISKNYFVSRYAYHHGYYDGFEREFRGFGLVEQWDTEDYESFKESPAYTTGNDNWQEESHVPPVYTRNWFHTGIYMGGDRVSAFYKNDPDEYFKHPDEWYLPDTILPEGLTAAEEREAYRALKGRPLRQEVYALDGSDKEHLPYSVTENSFHIRPEQPRLENRHAVFYVCACESLSFHYERDPSDPRISHQSSLEIDEFGNVTKSVAVVYPRRDNPATSIVDPQNAEEVLAKYLYENENAQDRLYATCSEAGFADKIDNDTTFRHSVPNESKTFELTGLEYKNKPFPKQELLTSVGNAESIAFEDSVVNIGEQIRLVEWSRILYYADDLTAPRSFGKSGPKAIPFETYTLAYTNSLLALTELNGYFTTDLLTEGKYLNNKFSDIPNNNESWWLPSGRQLYDLTKNPFYIPVAVKDPWDNVTKITYDKYHMLVQSTEDPLAITITAENDYRLLQPKKIIDPNGNQTKVAFDILGMVVGTAVMGKAGENKGDSLDGFKTDLSDSEITSHIENPIGYPHSILKNATTRLVYDLTRYQRTKETDNPLPNVVYTLAREEHHFDLDLGAGEKSLIQHSFVYSDGFGRETLTKIQAEDGNAPQRDSDGKLVKVGGIVQEARTTNRWVGTGKTVYNNKGKPIKQYEPFFDNGHAYTDETELVEFGVTPVVHYDPLERVIRTDMPNGTYTNVEFTPWQQVTYDENDTTILEEDGDHIESRWYQDRGSPDPTGAEPTDPETRAAWLAAKHANTPTTQFFDTLGRPFLTVAHNKKSGADEFIPTYTELDIEGNPIRIWDARDNQVMHYVYAIHGEQIYQDSMDAGKRWALNNVAGNPLLNWDERNHRIKSEYDSLLRPTHIYVDTLNADGTVAETILAERMIYGELLDDSDPGIPLAESKTKNRLGQLYLHFDNAGLLINDTFDFKGNLTSSSRRLLQNYEELPDWSVVASTDSAEERNAETTTNDNNLLEDLSKTYNSRTEFDALNRPIALTTPDNSVQKPEYNKANLLEVVKAEIRGAIDDTYVTNIDYNVKGQRKKIEYDNGAITKYDYDKETFRLTRLHTYRPDFPAEKQNVQDLQYFYDPVGNITEIRDNAQQTIFFDNGIVEPNSKYAYDALYRLIEAKGRESAATRRQHRDVELPMVKEIPATNQTLQRYTQTYTYDNVGNIEKMHHSIPADTSKNWIREYKYDEPNSRLSRTSRSGVAGFDTYNYDTHGNMLNMPHLPTMHWDYKDQLSKVDRRVSELEDGTQIIYENIFYRYDSQGQRVIKKYVHDNITDVRIYLGSYEIYRRYNNGSGDPKDELHSLHIMDDQQRVVMVETQTRKDGSSVLNPTNRIRYQFSNHLGSACLELNENAIVITYEEYHPYGTTAYQAHLQGSGVSQKRYRYTGKERDEESGLYYYGARYYVAWLGKWIAADPAGIVDRSNLYEFVMGNPITNNDLNGMVTKIINQNELNFPPMLIEGHVNSTSYPERPRENDYDFSQDWDRENWKNDIEVWKSNLAEKQGEGVWKKTKAALGLWFGTAVAAAGSVATGGGAAAFLGTSAIEGSPIIASGVIGASAGIGGEGASMVYERALGAEFSSNEVVSRLALAGGVGGVLGAMGGAFTKYGKHSSAKMNRAVQADVKNPIIISGESYWAPQTSTGGIKGTATSVKFTEPTMIQRGSGGTATPYGRYAGSGDEFSLAVLPEWGNKMNPGYVYVKAGAQSTVEVVAPQFSKQANKWYPGGNLQYVFKQPSVSVAGGKKIYLHPDYIGYGAAGKSSWKR